MNIVLKLQPPETFSGGFSLEEKVRVQYIIFIGLCLLFLPLSAYAVTCDAGYYLENNACVGCGQDGYYCPGDNIKYQCPTESNEILYSGLPGSVTSIEYVSWGCSLNSNSPNCCIVRGYGADDRGEYLWSRQYDNDSYSHNLAILWSVAYNGYYLSDVVSYTSDYYSNIYACTNAPANAHYTGSGTTATNCPWVCDAGYGRTKNDTCEPLCGAGITKLKTSTGLSFNLYASKHTTPSINVKQNNTVCYVNLETGNATNTINVRYGNTVYHTTN